MPAEFEEALLKALEKDPDKRQQKASQLARDIRLTVGLSTEPSFAYINYAGLVAALRQEGSWVIDSFRPSHDPFQTLAGALVPLLYANLTAEQKPRAVRQLAESLKSGGRQLYEVMKRIMSYQPAGTGSVSSQQ